MRDKIIGDLLIKLGRPNKTEEDFKKFYSIFKFDLQFKKNIGALNITNESDGARLLKKYCKAKSALPITDQNIEEVLLVAQKYCNVFQNGSSLSQNRNQSFSLWKLKKQIINSGIDKEGEVFLTFYEYANLGKRKFYSYCWDISKKS